MNKSVLIIESEPWLGDQYQRGLESQGFTVVRASNAYTAIDLVDQQHPAVIILGLLLSGASGLTLLHELQSYIDTAGIPVIVCSSLPNLRLDELQPYGVQRLIDSTTMQPDDLGVAVRSVLG